MRVLVLCSVLLLAACESEVILPGETTPEPCVGIFDTRDPALNYKLSVRNAVVGIAGASLIVPPVVILANETLCPVTRKPVPAKQPK